MLPTCRTNTTAVVNLQAEGASPRPTESATESEIIHPQIDRLLMESDGLEGIAWGQAIALSAADYPTALEQHLNRMAQLRDMEPSSLLSQMQQNLDKFING